jgi:ABC-type antimicrobial peptide transport system permease subunit
LAALGLYGVIAYVVSELTHEIGVRVAIGATRGHVVGLVMKRAVAIIGAGLGVGLLASLGATRFAASLLYEVDPLDMGTFVVVAVGMTGVVLVASYVPARRAAGTDPVAALRR